MDKIESGYAIKVTGYNGDGSIYNTGFVGDSFYVDEYNASIYDELEVLGVLELYKKEYNDGTVTFKLCKITRQFKIENII
jgi:hypothetical protein